jgi:hypothetical protein
MSLLLGAPAPATSINALDVALLLCVFDAVIAGGGGDDDGDGDGGDSAEAHAARADRDAPAWDPRHLARLECVCRCVQ